MGSGGQVVGARDAYVSRCKNRESDFASDVDLFRVWSVTIKQTMEKSLIAQTITNNTVNPTRGVPMHMTQIRIGRSFVHTVFISRAEKEHYY